MNRKAISVLLNTLIVILLMVSTFKDSSFQQTLSKHLSVSAADSVSPKTVIVPEDFRSIQEAINNVDDRDIILVKAGIYQEAIVINKSITLLGEERDSTIIDSNTSSDVITVMSSNCVICGFTIRNGGVSFPANCGIRLCNVDNNVICNNTIIGNFVGIKLGDKQRGSMANIIKDNNITGNRYGIFLAHSCQNKIYGNFISKNFWNGIELAWSHENEIYNNTICYNKAYGLEIPIATPSHHNFIYHNNFINNTHSASASKYENMWDNGYPDGGNYWSDYMGFDDKFGIFQNLTGNDGIGDTPYIIDLNNKDMYPLIIPFTLLTPVSNFIFYPEFPRTGEPVTFNASLSTSNGAKITSYNWDFGDGNLATGQIVTHKYSSPGTFTVILKVTNNRGFSSNMTKLLIVQSSYDAEGIIVKHFVLVTIIAVSVIFVWRFLKTKRFFVKPL